MKNETKLVILSKYFGKNFTGANIATHEILKRIEGNFQEVVVFTKQVGDFQLDNIQIFKYKNLVDLAKQLRNFNNKHNHVIGFSDDHFGFLFRWINMNYVHTYHGNWPDAKKINFIHFIKSYYYRPLYYLTLKNAKKVINVSYYMDAHVRKINSNTVVIRNGLGLASKKNELVLKKIPPAHELNLIMVGNIDKRKYSLALELFKHIDKQGIQNIKIDIYGESKDSMLAHKISDFHFVEVKGFMSNIEFDKYDLLLSTSKTENLSIAVCEALALGVPTITFNIGGLNEVISNGENGFTIPMYDVKQMLNCLVDIQQQGYTFDFSNTNLTQYDWDKAAFQYMKNFKL